MSLIVLLAGFALGAAEVCRPPDLDQTESSADWPFEVITEKNGPLRVRMQDVVSEPETLLAAEPDGPPPAGKLVEGTQWLYSEASDWLLVPVGLQVSEAVVGADGGWRLQMSAGNQVRLSASGTGACVGCALSAAGAWFPEQAKIAAANEFSVCSGMREAVELTEETSKRIRFKYAPAHGRPHAGVVIGDSDDYQGFRELTVAGLDAPVRDAVLNAFK